MLSRTRSGGSSVRWLVLVALLAAMIGCGSPRESTVGSGPSPRSTVEEASLPPVFRRVFRCADEGVTSLAPPHGGFAFGIDRLVMLMAGKEAIRDVTAFPKAQSGADPLTGAPAPVDDQQLRDLGIRLVAPPTKEVP